MLTLEEILAMTHERYPFMLVSGICGLKDLFIMGVVNLNGTVPIWGMNPVIYKETKSWGSINIEREWDRIHKTGKPFWKNKDLKKQICRD